MLAEAWHESGELRAWVAQEAAWQEGLARRLARSPAAPADAEELAHELSDLETYVRNRPADRLARIATCARALHGAGIMAAWASSELNALTRRWDELRARAATRAQLLEGAAHAHQRAERALDQLTQWADAAHRHLHQDAPDAAHPQVRSVLLSHIIYLLEYLLTHFT